MKISTNALCVLFMVLGVGFAFAGYGACTIPGPLTEMQQEFTFYPSGRPQTSSIEVSTWYYDGYCAGTEGGCHTFTDPEATKLHFKSDKWYYNDTDDDGSRLWDSVEVETKTFGLTLCGQGDEPIIAR